MSDSTHFSDVGNPIAACSEEFPPKEPRVSDAPERGLCGAREAFLASFSESVTLITEEAKDAIRAVLLDPREVAELLGLEMITQSGPGVSVLCPWHKELRPSCSLSIGQQGTLRAHCFACDKTGDIFSLLAAVRGWNERSQFLFVFRKAAELAGIDLACPEYRAGRRKRPSLAVRSRFDPVAPIPIGPADRAFHAILEPLLTHCALDEGLVSRDVCLYLKQRGMLEIARAEGWGALPRPGPTGAHWCRVIRGDAGQVAVESGLPRELIDREIAAIVGRDERFRFFMNRLLIPFRSPDGTIYTCQRRVLEDKERRWPKYVFPSSYDSEVSGSDILAREGRGRGARWPYGIERLSSAAPDTPVAYVEGPIDAGALRFLDAAAGRERVVLGVPGVSAWTHYFATFAVGRVAYIAIDADRHGDKAAEAWKDDLYRAGAREVVRERPVGVKDWSELFAPRNGNGK